ncbi:MAG: hypothetical protein J6O51_04870 [Bacteroidales bacterium]|nr:hypothetical protein [Bacteroidales bacterium]
MNKLLKITCLLAMAAGLAFSVRVQASSDVKPQWVRKGEEMMNRKRKSTGYEFKVFHTFNASQAKLKDHRFDPLLTYVREKYGADPMTVKLDSLIASPGAPTTYRISFGENQAQTVFAQLVDDYMSFEDYIDNEYGFELYQLFAVSNPGSMPVFDSFEVKECDNTKATLLSIIPSAGQFYKGANGRGAAILGGELAFAAGVAIYQYKKNVAYDNIAKGISSIDSWQSKVDSYKVSRNACIGVMAGIYIYGLLDAALSDGSSRVKVSDPQNGELTLGLCENGFGLTWRF